MTISLRTGLHGGLLRRPRRSDISTSVLTGDKADHFMVHATSDISLAYNLINSLPEVKKGETGITGISWGGIISSRGIGEDTRFKFAMPVYGCGNLTLSTGSIHPDRHLRREIYLCKHDESRYAGILD